MNSLCASVCLLGLLHAGQALCGVVLCSGVACALRGSAVLWLAPLASWSGVLCCSGILKCLCREVSVVPLQVGHDLAHLLCLMFQGQVLVWVEVVWPLCV